MGAAVRRSLRDHSRLKDVAAFWEKLWAMDLPRAFTADFEEYQPGGDMQHAEIHIYIALK